MTLTPAIPGSEVAILNRLIQPERNNLPATAARAFLKIDFDEGDRRRMRELSQKAQEGSLSAAEQTEIDSYERVGHLLDLLHSKARRSLKANGSHG
jgi:hypothetical protein